MWFGGLTEGQEWRWLRSSGNSIGPYVLGRNMEGETNPS
jgi:hypothetical protein